MANVKTEQGARALAACFRAGLLNKDSRHHYDEETMAEMIVAQVDAAQARSDPRDATIERLKAQLELSILLVDEFWTGFHRDARKLLEELS